MPRKVRFAQAGVTAIHANMFRDTLMLFPDDIEVVGFYDPDPDTARGRLKPNAQAVPFYGSIPELIEKAKPDAVMVSAYPRDMPGMAQQVVDAGVNLWMEKPFATHSRHLAPIAQAVERQGLVFSCGYSWRFHPIAQLIKQTYDDGLLGKPYSIDFRFLTTSVTRRNPQNLSFKNEMTGGGILNWLGCHWFDLMRYLTSSEVTRVAAIEANVGGHPIDVEDAAAVSLQFANGMIGSLHTGFFTPGDNETDMGIRGSLGWARWNVDENAVTIKSSDPSWATAPQRRFDITTTKMDGYGAEGYALIKAFVQAIRGEGESGYTVQDAIRSLQIIEAAHEAARTGKTVELPA